LAIGTGLDCSSTDPKPVSGPDRCNFYDFFTNFSVNWELEGSNFMLTAGIRIIETLFVLGVVGSGVVVILTTVEDVRTLFKKDNEP
jgi:hypothetical protein